MANRVLIGNKDASASPGTNYGYGMFVSKAGKDVLTCGRKDLLFDSSQGTGGSAFVYAAGHDLDISSAHNFLTTNSKDNLGYIPLVVHAEDIQNQTHNWATSAGYQTREWYATRTDILQTTSSTITPYRLGAGNAPGALPVAGRRTTSAEVGLQYDVDGTTHACTSLGYFVMKLPCAYGYMNSTYFEETD